MVNCEFCNREFFSPRQLTSHLQQTHKYFNMKEYYDKYLKKYENDGICKNHNCNNKTVFISLGLGYRKFCSKKCRAEFFKEDIKLKMNNRPPQICSICGMKFKNNTALAAHIYGLHKEEYKKIKLDKQIEYDENRPIVCNICNHRSKDLRLLEVHVNKHHVENNNKYNSKKEYYDKYLKKDEEGICKTCGKKTKFISFLHGYEKFCTNICKKSDLEELKIQYEKRELRKINLKIKYPVDQNRVKLIKKPDILKKEIIEDPNRIFVCNICEKKFLTLRDIGCHLVRMHGNGKRDILEKYYLDIIGKKDGEGICKKCGKKTKFNSLTLGYSKYCCNNCFCTDPKSLEIRRLNRLITMRDPNYEKNKLEKNIILKQQEENKKFKCEICGKKFNTIRSLAGHLTRFEFNGDKSKLEEYYNKYFKKDENEGICKACGNKTKFQSLTFGYLTYCSNSCMSNDPITHLKKQETSMNNYGVRYYSQTEEYKNYLHNGGASYMLSFVSNPSIPQCELHQRIKSIYKDTYLNFPILGYNVDIAVLSLKLVIEYDGSWYHQDKEKDMIRQKEIENMGWKFIRYCSNENGLDIIPSIEQIKKDINRIV